VIQDGNPALIQAASVSIHKSHGQYIENIHLQTYESEDHFWDVLYKEQYNRLISRAEEFLEGTGGPGEDALVFIRFEKTYTW
jgi:histone deacetylase HOS3